LLKRLAVTAPSQLRRGTPAQIGACVMWLALNGNAALRRGRTCTASEIWTAFEVTNAARTAKARRDELGVARCKEDRWTRSDSPYWLPDAQFLHSRTRRLLVERRDEAIKRIRADEDRRQEARPVQQLGNGQLRLRAKPVVPRNTFRTSDERGRAVVVVLFGDDVDPLESDLVLALNVPDARRLQQALSGALDGPLMARPAK
jgi:hypothetical protein